MGTAKDELVLSSSLQKELAECCCVVNNEARTHVGVPS